MTVLDFLEMFLDMGDQYFELWDVNKEEVVFKGYFEDLEDEELQCATVVSIDNIYEGAKGITLNVDVE